jgi:hypothetical protein
MSGNYPTRIQRTGFTVERTVGFDDVQIKIGDTYLKECMFE